MPPTIATTTSPHPGRSTTEAAAAAATSHLGAAVDRADRGVQIEGQRTGRVDRSRARGPQPGQQFAGHRVELAHVGPCERPQPGPDRRRGAELVEQLPVAPACSSAVSATESLPNNIDPTTVSA